MHRSHSPRGASRGRWLLASAAGLGLALVAQPSRAHFYLSVPTAWWTYTADGSPQKRGPCGDETVAGTHATNTVTTFQAGQTITVTWTETVSHTGWFRIAVAADRTAFVDPPLDIGPGPAYLSRDAGWEATPVLPVLADHLFPHNIGATPKTYTTQVTLPDTPCPKCTLQVLQYMQDHGPNDGFIDGAPNPDGYFYHHCADISIVGGEAGTEPLDATLAMDAPGGQDVSVGPTSGSASGGTSGATSGTSGSGSSGTQQGATGSASASGAAASGTVAANTGTSSGGPGGSSGTGTQSSSGTTGGAAGSGSSNAASGTTETTGGGSHSSGCALGRPDGQGALALLAGAAFVGIGWRRRRTLSSRNR